MPTADSNVGPLSTKDIRQLRDWVVAFARHWDPQLLDRFIKEVLPAADQPLRTAALLELACIDLRRRWEAGEQRGVADYLGAFPELGATAPLELILAECDARQLAGQAFSLNDLVQLYPQHEEALRARYSGAQRSDTQATDAYATPPPPSADNACLPTIPATIDELPEEFGRYRIQKVLGKGGMGSVYLARDRQLDRLVAMKVPAVRAHDRADVLDRFSREARIAARVEHPNICPVYDVGEIKGLPYLTMAYIDGSSLVDWTRSKHLRPPFRVAQLVRKLALTMAEAHRRGIVHRDLKPSNVMLRANGDPVIMDFGVARSTPEKTLFQSEAKSIVGTLEYMAPEQVLGQMDAMGPASDVYSLGVILYQLLTGRLPFEGHAATIVYRIVHSDPLSPRVHRPELDDFLSAICLKAIAKDLDERYASMDDLAGALATYLRELKVAVEPTVIPSDVAEPASSGSGPATDPITSLPPPPGPPTGPFASTSTPKAKQQVTGKPSRIATPAPSNRPQRTMTPEWEPGPDERSKRPVALLFVLVAAVLASVTVLGIILWKLRTTSVPTATERQPTSKSISTTPPTGGGDSQTKVPPADLARVNWLVAPAGAAHQLLVDGQPVKLEGGANATSLSPGKHRFKLMHEKLTYLDRVIDVHAGEQNVRFDLEITNSVQMRLRLIPVGKFQMGAPKEEVLPIQPDEGPRHEVTLTKPFYLGVFEVTREQYQAVMGNNPTSFPPAVNHPVDTVTWENAVEFCQKLSERPEEKAAGRRYRLPTEAEWEHSCRAGTTTPFFHGPALTAREANFNGKFPFPASATTQGDSLGRPTKVGSFLANPFGLHDVMGNVAEWVHDYYDDKYYAKSPAEDPAGPPKLAVHVLRGGSWKSFGRECRSADRATLADQRVELKTVGFRVAREVAN